jgi:hypothetical protein
MIEARTGEQDAEQLRALGYVSHFDRSMSLWENFALGFTYLSPVVGVYTIFATTFAAGGPPKWWTYLLLFARHQPLRTLVDAQSLHIPRRLSAGFPGGSCSEWWGVRGSNQWPLPCETGYGACGSTICECSSQLQQALRITWCHSISRIVTSGLSQNRPRARACWRAAIGCYRESKLASVPFNAS